HRHEFRRAVLRCRQGRFLPPGVRVSNELQRQKERHRMNTGLFRELMTRPDPVERFYGVAVGIVTNNQDPEKLHRVKVQFPWLDGSTESHWARVATPMAGDKRGLYFLPEVDDEVLIAFEHGAIDYPCVMGSVCDG